MQAGVRLIDTLLTRSLKIYEFTADPECILRIQLKRASHPVTIGEYNIATGDPVLGIHVWNQHMPKLSEDGPTLDWALHLQRQTVHSFRLIASEMKSDSRYDPIKSICGESALFSFTTHTGGTRLMEHLGFIVIPYHRPAGRFGEFWENLFSWWLMWTYNDPSLHSRSLWHLQRTEIWITRDEFFRRYG
jgi:hypothetical protein